MTPEEMEKLARLAGNTEDEIEAFVQAQSVLDNMNEKLEAQAKTIRQQADILAAAQNAIDDASVEKPWTPPADEKDLFDQVHAFVQAANALDAGTLQAHVRGEKDWKDEDRLDEDNPETVIDEKIKEEQRRRVQDDLKNEIVDALDD